MEQIYDMIVIGGGPAGYTAALYAARSGLSVLVLEKLSAGGQMALTEQIDNYPGFESGIDGFTLGEKMQQSAERFGAVTELAEVYKVIIFCKKRKYKRFFWGMEIRMNREVLLAVLGIVGTLGGALLGWLLNAYTYKIGRTVIRGTFETKITLPPVRPGSAVTGTAKTEYSIKCCAKNSRQIAVLLEGFYFEVQKSKGVKTVRVPALSAEDSCCSVGPIQVTARTAMEPQIIEPRKLNFFTVRIDTNDSEIQYAKLTLCAYDENRRLRKFPVYNGLKAERPPAYASKC